MPADDTWTTGNPPTLPGLELGAPVGSGAGTVVYRARRAAGRSADSRSADSRSAGTEYAVKVLTGPFGDREAVEFRREAALLACVDHPGLVTVHEVGAVAGRPYLVMDLIEGRSLAEVLRTDAHRPGLAEGQVVRLGLDVAEALTAAHRVGVVHRDVKPDNIMVTNTGRARLIDFGLAGRADPGRGADRAAGPAVGTFAYAAPEQTGMLSRSVDGRADLYGLGVVLFECLAGAPPFRADDAGEVIRLHRSATPPDLRSLRPGTSPGLARVVAKLLAKDPDDRYQTGEGLRADLARLYAGAVELVPGTTDVPGADRDTELVGRAGELARLTARSRSALAGRGGVALVHGPPGSGKSRLVRELTAVAVTGPARAGGAVLAGKCTPDSAVPMAVLREAVDRYGREVVARVRGGVADPASVTTLRSAVGDGATLLRTFSPGLADLLGVPPGGEDLEQGQLAGAVAALLVGLAVAAGGAILHLDDVQWCDDGTRRVLRRLAPLLTGAPLLVVCTARDDLAGAAGLAALDADLRDVVDVRIGLGPLGERAIADLVAAHLGSSSVPADLVARLARRTAGNPLAVVEYIRAVVDAGLVRPSWGTWVLDEAGLNALALPDDVLELVLRRVDGLPSGVRELLTVAAVAGTTFRPDLVAAAAGVHRAAVAQALAGAAGHRLIEPTGTGAYRFLHDRIREALLAALPPAVRAAQHRRIAEEMERAGGTADSDVYEIARHYLRGSSAGTADPVLVAAAAAGALALRQSAPREALEFLTGGATVATDRGLRLDAGFHADLGLAASRAGEYEMAQRHLRTALSGETDPLRRARLYRLIADAHLLRWEGGESIEAIRMGLREVGHRLPRNVAVLFISTVALFLYGVLLRWLPQRWRTVHGQRAERYRMSATLLFTCAQSAALDMRMSLVATAHPRTLHLVRRLPPGPEQVLSMVGSGMDATGTGRLRAAERSFARAVEASVPLGDPRLTAKIRFLEAIAHDVIRPASRTTGVLLTRNLRDHGRWMDAADYLSAVNCQQEILLLRGYVEEAAAWYRRGVESAPDGAKALGIHVAALEARISALSGRTAEAARQLDRVRASLAARHADLPRQVDLAIATVHVAVERAEYGPEFEDVVASFNALRVRPSQVFAADRMYWVYQAFCRLEQARRQAGSAQLATAEAAVGELGGAVHGPVLRAYHQVALAALQSLGGEHSRALRTLGDLTGWSIGLDVPLLDYEIARIRARACYRLGLHADARRQAQAAVTLADTHGWPHRARWIRTEFGIDGPAAAVPGRSAGSVGSDLQERRMRALYQVSLAAATVLDADQLTRVVLDEIVRIFGAERAFLFLHEGDGLVPYRGRDADGTDLERLTGYGSSLVDRVHASGTPLVVTGSEQGAALGSQSAMVHGLRSIMVAPLAVRGSQLGVVYLDSRAAKGIFTGDDVGLLAAITNHVGLALETARAATLERAVVAVEQERDTAQVLHEAMAELTASLDPDEVAQRLLAVVSRVLPADTAVLLRRPAGGKLTMTGTAGAEGMAVDERDVPALDALLRSTATLRGERSADAVPLPALLGPDADAWLAVPLHTRAEDHGLLLVARAGRAYTAAEAEIATALTRQGQAALDNAVLFRQVEELATRDALTGIFNRRHFFDLARRHVSVLRGCPQPLATIMIDIDHFKAVNDTYGHRVGDEVIRTVAGRLAGVVRDRDVLCRYGGEEFAVLLPDTDPVAAERAAALLHAAVCRSPISTAGGPLLVTVSVGLAATTDPEADLNTLLTRADEALYEAKRAGRNRVAMSGLPVWSGLPIPSGLPVASGLPAQPRSGSGRPGGPAGSPSTQE